MLVIVSLFLLYCLGLVNRSVGFPSCDTKEVEWFIRVIRTQCGEGVGRSVDHDKEGLMGLVSAIGRLSTRGLNWCSLPPTTQLESCIFLYNIIVSLQHNRWY